MKKQLLALLTFTVIISSCSKKSEPKPEQYTIDHTSVSTNFDKEHQFIISQGETKIDPVKVKFTSSNEITGSVDSKGLFKAKRIGTTTVKAELEGKTLISDVTITPYSTIVQEPFLEYSASKSTIKSKEKRIIEGETTTGILYKGENSKVENVFYAFENGAMTGSIIVFSYSSLIVEEVVKFYSERYNYVGMDNDVFYFRDKSSIVAITYTASLGFHAIYVKNTTGTSNRVDFNTLKGIFGSSKEGLNLKQLLK